MHPLRKLWVSEMNLDRYSLDVQNIFMNSLLLVMKIGEQSESCLFWTQSKLIRRQRQRIQQHTDNFEQSGLQYST
jgi:hypothetical protein